MPGYLFLAPPFIMLLAARRVLARRGRAALDHALSLGCAAIGLAIWPSQNALVFDGLAHVPGLAHVVTDTSMSLMFLLQFNFTSALRRQWPRVRSVLLATGAALIALHAVCWLVDELTVPGDHTYLFYGHYYGRPVQLLITNIVLGLTIVFCAALCLGGYVRSLLPDHPARERLTVASIATTTTAAVIYGALIPVQAIADATGHGASSVTSLTVPIMSVTVVLATITISTVLYGRRAVQYARDLFSVRRQRELVQMATAQQQQMHERAQQRLVSLSIMVNEGLLRVRQDYSAAAAVEAVANACTRRGLSLECRRIAREAVRIISLNYENVLDTPFFDLDELEAYEREGMAAYFTLHLLDGSFFYDHVYKVAALAIGNGQLMADLVPADEIEDWHIELAQIVADALRDYKRSA